MGYPNNEDDNPPEHGRDTAIWQELQPPLTMLEAWLRNNANEFWSDETKAKAALAVGLLAQVCEELDVKL